MRHPRRTAAISLLLLTLAGCRSGAGGPGRIAGSWTADAPGQEGGSAAPGRLLLQEDGHFQATALPSDLADDPELVDGKPLTGSGTWALERGGDAQLVALNFDQMEGAERSELPYRANLQIDTHRWGTTLFFDSGDPDEDERVTFHKQSVLSKLMH